MNCLNCVEIRLKLVYVSIVVSLCQIVVFALQLTKEGSALITALGFETELQRHMRYQSELVSGQINKACSQCWADRTVQPEPSIFMDKAMSRTEGVWARSKCAPLWCRCFHRNVSTNVFVSAREHSVPPLQ